MSTHTQEAPVPPYQLASCFTTRLFPGDLVVQNGPAPGPRPFPPLRRAKSQEYWWARALLCSLGPQRACFLSNLRAFQSCMELWLLGPRIIYSCTDQRRRAAINFFVSPFCVSLKFSFLTACKLVEVYPIISHRYPSSVDGRRHHESNRFQHLRHN